jgi:hypothetical protein
MRRTVMMCSTKFGVFRENLSSLVFPCLNAATHMNVKSSLVQDTEWTISNRTCTVSFSERYCDPTRHMILRQWQSECRHVRLPRTYSQRSPVPLPPPGSQQSQENPASTPRNPGLKCVPLSGFKALVRTAHKLPSGVPKNVYRRRGIPEQSCCVQASG